MKPVGLYIHIPFCHAKCGYCDFATFVGLENKIDDYLAALSREMSFHHRAAVDTIFVGGGTPTVLSPKQIDTLFSAVRENFDLTPLTEATIEANPESAGADVLEAYRANGINRVSFGLQTTNDALLKKIDRLHSFEEFCAAYARARERGFSNINIDLIFGLPGQTLEDWLKAVDDVVSLQPEHLSAYALKVESGTQFARDHVEADSDLQADMYLQASDRLSKNHYRHYEISNFSRPGFESKHNLKYWLNHDTVGVGVSSASFYQGKRWKNTRQLVDYLERLQKGASPSVEEIVLDPASQEKEAVMLALRLESGVAVREIEKIAEPIFEKFRREHLAKVEKGMYSLNPQGWLLSNQLFQYLV